MRVLSILGITYSGLLAAYNWHTTTKRLVRIDGRTTTFVLLQGSIRRNYISPCLRSSVRFMVLTITIHGSWFAMRTGSRMNPVHIIIIPSLFFSHGQLFLHHPAKVHSC